MNEQSKVVAAKLGIKATENGHELDHRSLLATMGGIQGIAESVIPGLLFVVLMAVTKLSMWAVIAAGVSSAIFITARAIRRQSLMNAVVGLGGIGLAAFLALRAGGSGRDYFIPGLITNLSYGAVLLLSVVARFPLLGVIVGFALGEKLRWRKNRYEMRIFTAATLIMAAVFVIRLVVEVPLFLGNQLEALAIAKIILGLPLYATALWCSWLLIRALLSRRSAT